MGADCRPRRLASSGGRLFAQSAAAPIGLAFAGKSKPLAAAVDLPVSCPISRL
jgi:hypothetical protein